jgi:hypothetical protein
MLANAPRMQRHLLALHALAASIALAACGGKVIVDPNGTGGSGSTSSSTTSSGQGACVEGTGKLDFQLKTFDGHVIGCSIGGTQDSTHLEGIVTTILGPQDIELDSCPPNADCGSKIISTLHFDTSPTWLAGGQFVAIDAWQDQTQGCSHAITVKNLPSWGGIPNPIDPTPRVMFAGGDGFVVGTADPSAFSVIHEAYCASPGGAGLDALVFSAPGVADLVVPPSGDVNWPQNNGTTMHVLNLRSSASAGYAWRITDLQLGD